MIEQQLPEAPDTSEEQQKLHKRFRQAIDGCKKYRRQLIQNWQVNVSYRRGKPYATQADEDRVVVNLDWSLTKQKQAALFSQVPAIRINHPPQTLDPKTAPWIHTFEQRVNDIARESGIETAMDECLPDCINAAGIGVVLVAREAITEDVEVPAIDMATLPSFIHQQIMATGLMPDGSPVPMKTVPRVLDARYLISRLSPSDFLWDLNFIGSDFDNAPWTGRSGKLPWVEAADRWKLDPALKNKYCGVSENKQQEKLTYDIQKEDVAEEEYVYFDEVFYKERCYSPNAKSFSLIHHLVFVNGQDAPVVDEPWKGQQVNPETGEVTGALRYPIRVLSLSYITDEAIPPSDTAIGRPQVDEINKSRTQMINQREHSIPVRWFDVNRVDPAIQYSLMRGTWQGMIPVQGVGTNIIGEVARSAHPVENFTFDRIAKNDLNESWQVGQQSGLDIETRAEVQAVDNNMQARTGRERAKVGKFFCTIAEVLGGLMCLYEDPNTFGQGFDPRVSRSLSYSILADSTLLLDTRQRIKQLVEFTNFFGKSGWLNIEAVGKEAATLHGLDPAVVIRAPQPRPPSEPNISLRLTGTEDMLNPLTLGFLIKAGQAPGIAVIEQAKKLIEAAVMPPVPPPPMDPSLQPGAPIPQVGPLPNPPTPAVGEAEPQWSSMPRVDQRVLGEGEGGTQ